MTDLLPFAISLTGPSLRLRTLTKLRWLAVSGQTATVLLVGVGLGFPLPILPCFILIGLSALLNIGLSTRFPASRRLESTGVIWLLSYDVLQLGALLYLTGGLDNPFIFLMLVPMIVSATTLAARPTILLGTLVVATATFLLVEHLPLPWFPGQTLSPPLLFSAGVWFALIAACAFSGIYTFQVAEETRQLGEALNATEAVLAREQHLSALDGLAAAAAHELGTPLATIVLIAKELEREMPPDSPDAEDIALLKSQAQRCRDILTKLTSLSTSDLGHPHIRQPLSHLIEEIAEPYRMFMIEIVIAPPADGEPVGRRNPAVIQGLANLVENAVDFARNRVDISSEWDDKEVTISIADDGPGFAPGILKRIGEPYVTTRGHGTHDHADDAAGGLGLGLFIAKALLERSGALLTMTNRKRPDAGAIIRITWPRARFEDRN